MPCSPRVDGTAAHHTCGAFWPWRPTCSIAAAIGDYLGLPTVSVAPQDAQAHFGWIGHFFGMDLTASSAHTQQILGWRPSGPTLFEDIAAGAYAPPK